MATMSCPSCEHTGPHEVVDSRLRAQGKARRRRYECAGCGLRWTTEERVTSRNLRHQPKLVTPKPTTT